jgi:CRP/FNR family transcriptional regulator, cyclic AMP receptor protein
VIESALVEILQKVPLLADLSRFELRQVLERAGDERVPPGADLLTEGESGASLLVMVEGAADVIINGKPVRTIRKGDYVGEMAIIDGLPRSATVRAVTECRVLSIPAGEFRALVESSWELAWKLLTHLSLRVREMDSEVHQ